VVHPDGVETLADVGSFRAFEFGVCRLRGNRYEATSANRIYRAVRVLPVREGYVELFGQGNLPLMRRSSLRSEGILAEVRVTGMVNAAHF
jgi:hypothetical protein